MVIALTSGRNYQCRGRLTGYRVAVFGESPMESDMLIDELCDRLLAAEYVRRVADVRIGLGYTGVLLDDGRCGLAYTFRHETGAGCGVIGDAGTLAGRMAADVAVMVKAQDPITAAVGLATLNAMAEPPSGGGADILGVLAVTPEDEVGMVGNFGPLAGPLRKQAKALHIFERQANPANDVLGADMAARPIAAVSGGNYYGDILAQPDDGWPAGTLR